MCPPQGILGVLVVIEANRDPLGFAVTGFALVPITSRMNVLNLVAINACCPDPTVALAAVTGRTGNADMRLVEREFGCTMVEGLGVVPFGFAMTFVTRLAQAPFVWIGGLVAIDAAPRRITEFCGHGVATSARHRYVRTLQGEIRGRMIEGLAIEL